MSRPGDSKPLIAKTFERAWSSFALLMTAVGWSVGAGNYWRFSWRAANYGGGSFLLSYLIWLIIVAFPLSVAEYAIGKLGRGGPIHGPITSPRGTKSGLPSEVCGWPRQTS